MRRLPVLGTVNLGAVKATAKKLVRATIDASSELPVPEHWRGEARKVMQTVKDAAESMRWPQRPQELNVELTAICDAKCIHCPRHDMDRSQRPMDFTLYKRIIDEAAEMGVPDLCPNGFGELLTMRDVDRYLAYARSKPHRFRIMINSNGFRMDDEKIDTFLRHEVDFLNITLDGATAETFEKIRVKLKLDQIEDNIHRLLAERKKRNMTLPKVRVGMIALPQNSHEIDMLLDKWRGVVDFVGVGGFTNRAGSLDETGLFGTPPADAAASTSTAIQPLAAAPARHCLLPFRDLNVWADGRAVLCCDDWNEEHVIGDLTKQSLRDVWRGDALHKVRELHMAGRGGEIDLCSKCSMWREPSPGARLWS